MNYDVKEAEEAITESVGYLVANNRTSVVKILRKNGVDVGESMSDKELLTAIYTSLAESPSFGVDLKKLIYSNAKESFQNMGGYVNGSGAFKDFLKGVFTPETTGALINTGVNALSKKLSAKEDAAMLDKAIALKVKETEALVAKGNAAEQASKKNKWVVPAIVVGGLVVVAVTAIIIYRKNRK